LLALYKGSRREKLRPTFIRPFPHLLSMFFPPFSLIFPPPKP
ncbi:hypothetical protein LINGRAHAP2_LOCUS24653, partial [Linum grandiflorum]